MVVNYESLNIIVIIKRSPSDFNKHEVVYISTQALRKMLPKELVSYASKLIIIPYNLKFHGLVLC